MGRIVLVRFIHPGKEHRPHADTREGWNTRDHRRKLMGTAGRYVQDGQVQATEMGFWAVWEPESDVVRFTPQLVPDGPLYVYPPFYRLPENYTGKRLQNIDT